MSHVWKSGSRKKKTKPTYKIRWDVLGLPGPERAQSTLSMDTIRSEVSLMATQRLAERTPAPSAESRIEARRPKPTIAANRSRRRTGKD
jgi:hypothetical protein